MNSPKFTSLIIGLLALLAYAPLSSMPERGDRPAASVPLWIEPVSLAPVASPLKLAGAWRLAAPDPRFRGLSGLAIDGDRFMAVGDTGSVVRFARPGSPDTRAWIDSLRDGPGPGGWKNNRDAESIVPDPRGRGWWVGYEQRHSLWLYDRSFRAARVAIALPDLGWPTNRGAESLVADGDGLLVLAENGRDGVRANSRGVRRLAVESPADIAEAARAPDGKVWVLLRQKGLGGISQWIAPLSRVGDAYVVGRKWALPKAMLDNYEGMAIERSPSGGLRFWLLTDDGHRIFARSLLVALDLPRT